MICPNCNGFGYTTGCVGDQYWQEACHLCKYFSTPILDEPIEIIRDRNAFENSLRKEFI